MLTGIPALLQLGFLATVFLGLGMFYKAIQGSSELSRRSPLIIFVILFWLAIQGLLSFKHFYSSNPKAVPPPFLLLVLPPFFCILFLFLTKWGRGIIDGLSTKVLTLIHVIRIPVELTLFSLFTYKAIPQLMTFEGRNFDIIAGISAPVIYFIAFRKPKPNFKLLLVWNIAALALLINIVVNGILSAPSAFQKFAFDQPNIALLHFPFTWLPGFIVPLVLFSHLVCIRKAVLKIT